MASPDTPLRDSRRLELVRATRAIFDARGAAEAPVEEIAQAVGIARGLIYRQFRSKDELVVLTVATYLAELAAEETAAVQAETDPPARLRACVGAYVAFCRRHPAFLDGQMLLMRRSADELRAEVGEDVWVGLGEGMAGCLGTLADVLRDGTDRGAFAVDDAPFTANLLWSQMLGAMHLARIRVGVLRSADGAPGLFAVSPDDVGEGLARAALAAVAAP